MVHKIDRRVIVVLLLALSVGGLPTPARSDGGDTAIIHACLARNGSDRIVGPNDACRAMETATH